MLHLAAAVALLLVICGCATPQSRINKNPELFATFPPDVQAKVRQGVVALGFSRDMAQMALGNPHRVYSRQTQDETHEVWVYTTPRYYHRYEPLRTHRLYRDSHGRIRSYYDIGWVDVTSREAIESLRLEFDDEAVNAVESLRN